MSESYYTTGGSGSYATDCTTPSGGYATQSYDTSFGYDDDIEEDSTVAAGASRTTGDESTAQQAKQQQQQPSDGVARWIPQSPKKKKQQEDAYTHYSGEGQELQLKQQQPTTSSSNSLFCYQGLQFAKHNDASSSPASALAEEEEEDSETREDAITVVANNLPPKKEKTTKGLSYNKIMKSMVSKLAKRVLPSNYNTAKKKDKDNKAIQTPPPRDVSHNSTPATWSRSPSSSHNSSPKADSNVEGSPSVRRTLFDGHDSSPLNNSHDATANSIDLEEEREDAQHQQARLQQQQVSTSATTISTTTILDNMTHAEQQQQQRRNVVLSTIRHHSPGTGTSSSTRHHSNKKIMHPIDLDETPPSSPNESFASALPTDTIGGSAAAANTSRMVLASTPASSTAGTTGSLSANVSMTGVVDNDNEYAKQQRLAMDLNNITVNPALDGSFAFQQHEVRLKPYGEGPIDLDITPPDDGSFAAGDHYPADQSYLNDSMASGRNNGSFSMQPQVQQPPSQVQKMRSTSNTMSGGARPVDLDVTIATNASASSNMHGSPSQVQRLRSIPNTRPVDLDDTIVTNASGSFLHHLPPSTPTASPMQQTHSSVNRVPVDLDDTIASSNNGSFMMQQEPRSQPPPPQIHRVTRPVDLGGTIASSNNGSFQRQPAVGVSGGRPAAVDLDDTIASTIASSRNGSWIGPESSYDNSILAGINKNGALVPIQPGEVDRTLDFSINSSDEQSSFFRQHRLENELDQAIPGRQVYSGPVEDQDLDDSMAWSNNKSFSSSAPPAAPKKSSKPPRPPPRLPPSGRDSRQRLTGEIKKPSSKPTIVLQHSISLASANDSVNNTEPNTIQPAPAAATFRRTDSGNSMSPKTAAGDSALECKLASSQSEDSVWNDLDDSSCQRAQMDENAGTVAKTNQLKPSNNTGGKQVIKAKPNDKPKLQVKPKPLNQRPPRPPPPAYSGAQARLSAVWEEPRSLKSDGSAGPVDLDDTVETTRSGNVYTGPVDLDETVDDSVSTDDHSVTGATKQSGAKNPLWSGFVSDSEESDGASDGVFFSKVLAPNRIQPAANARSSDHYFSSSEEEGGRFVGKREASSQADWVDFSKSLPAASNSVAEKTVVAAASEVKSTAVPGKLRSHPKDTPPVSQQMAHVKRSEPEAAAEWCNFDQAVASSVAHNEDAGSDLAVPPAEHYGVQSQAVKITVNDVPLTTPDDLHPDASLSSGANNTTTDSIKSNTSTTKPAWRCDHDNCHGVPDTIDPEDSDLLQGEQDAWSAQDILQDINSDSSKEAQRYVSQASKLEQQQIRPFQKIRFKQKRASTHDQNSISDRSDPPCADDVFGVGDSAQFEDGNSGFNHLDGSDDSLSAAKLVQQEFENGAQDELPLTSRDKEESNYSSDALEIQRFKKTCMEHAMNASMAKSDINREIEEEDTITSSLAGDRQSAQTNYASVMKELEMCFNISRQSHPTESIDSPPAESSVSLCVSQMEDSSFHATSMYKVNESSMSDIQQQINTALVVAAEARESLDPTKLEQEISKLRATAAALRRQVQMAAEEQFDSSGQSLSSSRGTGNTERAGSFGSSTHPFDEHTSTDSSGNHADDEGGFSGRDDSISFYNTSRESNVSDEVSPPSIEASMMDKVHEELAREFQADSTNPEGTSTPKRSNREKKSVAKRMLGAFSRVRSAQGSRDVSQCSRDVNDSAFDFKTMPQESQADQLIAQFTIKNKVVDQIRRLRLRNNRSQSCRNVDAGPVANRTYSSKSEMIAYDFRKCPKSCLAAPSQPSFQANSPKSSRSLPKPKKSRLDASKILCGTKTKSTSEDLFVADFYSVEALDQTRVEANAENLFIADFSKWSATNDEANAESARPAPVKPEKDLSPVTIPVQETIEDLHCELGLPSLDFQEETAVIISKSSPSATRTLKLNHLVSDTADFTAESEDAARKRFQVEDTMISYLLRDLDPVTEAPRTANYNAENLDMDGLDLAMEAPAAANCSAEIEKSLLKSLDITNGDPATREKDDAPIAAAANQSTRSQPEVAEDNAGTAPHSPKREPPSASIQENSSPSMLRPPSPDPQFDQLVEQGPHSVSIEEGDSRSPDPHFDRLVESLVRRASSDPSNPDPSDDDEFETAHESMDASLDYSEDTLRHINNSILVETVGYDEEFSTIGQDAESIRSKKSTASFKTSRSMTQATRPQKGGPQAPPSIPRKNATKHKHSSSEGSAPFAGGTFTAFRNIMTGGLSPWEVPTIFKVKEGPTESEILPESRIEKVDPRNDVSIGEAMSVELVLSAPPPAHRSSAAETEGRTPFPIPEHEQSMVSPPPKTKSSSSFVGGKSPAGVAEMDSYYFEDATMTMEDSGLLSNDSDEESIGNGPRSLTSQEEEDYYFNTTADTHDSRYYGCGAGLFHQRHSVDSMVLKEPFSLVRSETPDRHCRIRSARKSDESVDSDSSEDDCLAVSYSNNMSNSHQENPLGLAMYSNQAEL